jgi:hypothetical protein
MVARLTDDGVASLIDRSSRAALPSPAHRGGDANAGQADKSRRRPAPRRRRSAGCCGAPKNEASDQKTKPPLIRWSVQEVRRIATRLAQRRIRPAHVIAWVLWRRAHQAAAQHAARQIKNATVMLSRRKHLHEGLDGAGHLLLGDMPGGTVVGSVEIAGVRAGPPEHLE